DTRARAGLANTYGYMGGLLMRKGDLTRALENQKQALALRQALSDSDPTNSDKRLHFAYSQGYVGDTLVALAFQKHISTERRAELCRQADSWLQKGLSGMKRDHSNDVEFLSETQHAADRCNAALFPRDSQNLNSRTSKHP